LISWQSIVKDLDKYGLSQEDVSQRVYWADGENVLGGSKAVFLAGKCLKQPWSFISSFGLLPGMSIIAEPVYRLIARNRHRLPGSTDACAFDGQKSGKKTVLGLELFFGKDVQTKLEIESKNLTERNFSYKEVGASKGAFPSGYVKDAYSAIGQERSEAVEKFKEFTCHKIAGLVAPGDFRFEKICQFI
jgi:predicted DCC family thiol-disulfide oxidoreductase YuxK